MNNNKSTYSIIIIALLLASRRTGKEYSRPPLETSASFRSIDTEKQYL